MAWGAIEEPKHDPKVSTPFGDNFYPPQKDPDQTTLPAAPAPATVGNLWTAVKMTKLSDFSVEEIGKKPCLKSSILQGAGAGFALGAARYVIGPPGGNAKIITSYKWFTVSFLVIGGVANYRCFSMRNQELQQARLMRERYPERLDALKAKARAEAEAKVAADLASGKLSPTSSKKGPTQKVVPLAPQKVESSQNYVMVRDASGEFMGRLNQAQTKLALERGGQEDYLDAEGNKLGLINGEVVVVERGNVEGRGSSAGAGVKSVPGGVFERVPEVNQAGEIDKSSGGFWKSVWG